MKFSEYQTLSRRTMTLGREPDHHKMIAGLGLTGEVAELIADVYANQEASQDEGGDVIWYLAFLCELYGFNLFELAEDFSNTKPISDFQEEAEQMVMIFGAVACMFGLVKWSGLLADLIKKECGHHHEPEPEKIKEYLIQVLRWLSALLFACGVSLEDACIENIEKLKRRYPDGFNSRDSIQRSE